MKNKTWKSTQKDIDKMIELYKSGISMSEIGRMLELDHTSVMYWVKKYIKEGKAITMPFKVGRPRKKILSRSKTKKKRGGDRYGKIRLAKDVCQSCGKKKEEFDPKMRLTNFCSIKCWDDKTMGKNYYN